MMLPRMAFDIKYVGAGLRHSVRNRKRRTRLLYGVVNGLRGQSASLPTSCLVKDIIRQGGMLSPYSNRLGGDQGVSALSSVFCLRIAPESCGNFETFACRADRPTSQCQYSALSIPATRKPTAAAII